MEQWEYRVEYLVRFRNDGDVPGPDYRELWQHETEERLNKLGAEGWELVQMKEAFLEHKYDDGFCVFKRRLEHKE